MDATTIQRLRGNIESLAENPRPPGARKLRGTTASWRIRVGDYRILYTIDEGDSIVEVVRVRHRSTAYEA